MLHAVAHSFLGLARRTWIVTVITVISCAALAARTATSFIAAGTLDGVEPPAAAATPLAPRAAPAAVPGPSVGERRRTAGDHLVERNIFCSSCLAAGAAPGAGVFALVIPAILIETSLGTERRATVRVPGSEVQGSWGVGDTIPGLGLIARIAPTWLELVDPTGRRGRLSLLDTDLAAGRGPDTAMSEGPPAAAPRTPGVRKLDDQTYEVERGLIRDLVSGAASAGGVRPVPIFENGGIKGIRLPRVPPASIAHELGLRSGDQLTAIDGEPIRNVQQLLDLYARLDQLSSVELSGLRAGKPLVRALRLR